MVQKVIFCINSKELDKGFYIFYIKMSHEICNFKIIRLNFLILLCFHFQF